MSDSQVALIHDFLPVEIASGVRIKALFGNSAMVNLVELDPGGFVPLHKHPHEQIGYVVSGQILMTIAGEEHHLEPGGSYVIPGGIEHSALAGPEGCEALDFFCPIREDYRDLVLKDR
tara:strand:+ start:322 stop:675 length:354 start_codon:yes stop_codon:yes gene_type:complete